MAKSPIYHSTMAAALCDPENVNCVTEAVEQITKQCGPPSLIIFDTVARNFGPGDENSTKDMTAFVAACDLIRAQYKSTILLVHHTGQIDKTRARGSIALKGGIDAEYRLNKDADGIVRLENLKMKDAEKPEPMAFKIRSVELGFNDKLGKPVTSAILDPTEYTPAKNIKPLGRGKNQIKALKALQNLHDGHRANLEKNGFPIENARVSVEDWQQRCSEKMDRKAFYKVRDSLTEQGLISIRSGYVQFAHFGVPDT